MHPTNEGFGDREIRAHVTINASGPWVDRVAQLAGTRLTLADAGPLRDDVSTDEITPVHIMSYYDDRLARFAYTGFRGETFNSLHFSFADWWGALQGETGATAFVLNSTDNYIGFSFLNEATGATMWVSPIADAEFAHEPLADGAVVGSALLQHVATATTPEQTAQMAADFWKSLR